MSMPIRLTVGVILAASALTANVHAATLYQSRKILQTTDNVAMVDLNNATHGLGNAVNPTPGHGPLLFWANGDTSDQGFDQGTMPTTNRSFGTALNNLDDIVGYAQTFSNGSYDTVPSRAFLLSAGHFQDLSTYSLLRGNASVATALNNSGDAVGYWEDGQGQHAFLYSHGAVSQIAPPTDVPSSNPTQAFAINAVGQIAGRYLRSTTGTYYPFISDHGVSTLIQVKDATSGAATAINDQGQVIGTSSEAGRDQFCFIYSNGAVMKMGSLGGAYAQCTPRKINNSGIAVGKIVASGDANDPASGAFVYSNGTMTKLDALISPTDALAQNHIHLVDAVAINDKSEIIASDGTNYYLLTPASDTPLPPSDSAYYNFETDAQGWANRRQPIITVSTSTAQKFAGSSSLAVQIVGTGVASVGVGSPPALAGKTVTFHIYVPADANFDGLQPFALEDASGGWAWHGIWKPLDHLQRGAWNTVTLAIPSTAKTFWSLGVEINQSQSYQGTVYIDSVSF
jgi:probable HAF family extracellular repeat protein